MVAVKKWNYHQYYFVVHLWALLGSTEEDGPEGFPVLATHQVVEDRVQGGGKEVETARHIHQVLVECSIPSSDKGQELNLNKSLDFLKKCLNATPLYVEVVVVVVDQALNMKGSPRDEEKDHHRH